MFEIIMSLLASAWNYIKKIVLQIINFIKNIISWFKNRDRLEQIKKNDNLLAVSIKEKMNDGNYNVVNCLFDEDEDKIVEAEVMQSGSLDLETRSKFGNKEMILLK
jgi:hypothetical protein